MKMKMNRKHPLVYLMILLLLVMGGIGCGESGSSDNDWEINELDGDGDSGEGDGEAGDGEAGDGEAGDGEAGDGEAGDGEVGDGEAGDGEAGDGEAGDGEAGDGEAGDGEAGDGEAGDGEAGDGDAGDGEAGDGEAGDGEAGDGDGDPLIGTLSVSPSELEFQLLPSSESEEKVLTFTNIGDQPLSVSNFSLEDGNGRFSTGQNFPNGQILLAAGQNYQMGIRYMGQDQEDLNQSGALVFTTNDSAFSGGSIPLTITPAPVPVLSHSPAELLFPLTLPGAGSILTLEIENTGLEDLIIESLSIDPLSRFSVSSTTALPYSIAPGGALEVEVTFVAPSLNALYDELLIESNDPNSPETYVTLGGNINGAPCMNLSAGELAFGNSAIDEVTYRVLHIENCSDEHNLEVSSIEVVDDSDDVFFVTPASMPTGGTAVVAPLGSRTLVVGFEPTEAGAFEGDLVIESNAFLNPDQSVVLSGTGVGSVGCPVAVAEGRVGNGAYSEDFLTAQVLDEVQLRGSNSTDPQGSLLIYEWTLISAPGGSQSSISSVLGSPTGTLFLDVSGTYEVELNVYNIGGVGACETAILEIQATTGSDILIELTWIPEGILNPSAGSGSDLDLHYHHSNGTWGDQNWSVYWMRREQTWDGSTVSLDLDSLFGDMPEIISHANPASGVYTVGVHYYSQGASSGYSDATVRIFMNGVLGFEKTKRIFSVNDLWEVGSIIWSSNPSVVEIDQIIIDHDLPSGF